MAGDFLREEYISRINRVQDYIEANLDGELSVQKLAAVANFSPYHFHRIYSAITGEPLFQHIQRMRLEKSAYYLIANPKKSITQIAFECGFTSQASFARAFKKFFQVSASEWRSNPAMQERKNCKVKSKSCQTDRKPGKELSAEIPYNGVVSQKHKWREYPMAEIAFQVEVKEMPDFDVAYIRHTGSYKGDSALFQRLFEKLLKWADARGLVKFPETRMLTIYHDNPELTAENKLRLSACLTVPQDTAVDGEIGKMKVQGGKYAIGHFAIKAEQYQEAWNAVYGKWLPESGYQPDDGACFELYRNDPDEHPEHLHAVDIYVPVKPL